MSHQSNRRRFLKQGIGAGIRAAGWARAASGKSPNFVQKPMTHDVCEARRVAQAAATAQLAPYREWNPNQPVTER